MPAPTPPVADPVPRSRMATAALWLSVFAFFLPIGIGALVAAYFARREIRESRGRVGGSDFVLAATALATTQIVLVCVTGLVLWRAYYAAADPFRRDAVLQEMFRAEDQLKPLTRETADQESEIALSLMNQIIAGQDAYYRTYGFYRCNVQAIINNGIEGATDAEKRAFAQRFQRSPYIYEINNCSGASTPDTGFEYHLIATPAPPRMPPNSLLFCADRSGQIQQIRGGTSLDCFDHGVPRR